MNISQLLELLKDPNAVLSISEKLIAGVCVALLSMSVVFVVLVLISIIIRVLQSEKEKPQIKEATPEVKLEQVKEVSEEDENLVSVITAAICALTGNSTHNIQVRKIVRSNNSKSSWECMSTKITK